MSANYPLTEEDPVSLAALQDEIDAREAADDVLSTAIGDEVSDRATADSALEVDIDTAQATADAALPKAGGTMTGAIVLAADPTANLHPATKQYVASQIAALIAGAPGTLDTLNEIAAQLGTDESAVATLTSTVAGKLAAASNLGDLVNAVSARSNLGLGDSATKDVGVLGGVQGYDSDLASIAALSTTSYGRAFLALADAAAARTAVGLGNVDNTSDADKPVSTAQQTALDTKLNKVRVAHSFAIVSPAVQAYGGLFISLSAGETQTIKKVRVKAVGGTATASLRLNGSNTSDFSGLSLSSTPGSTSGTQALAEDDFVDLNVTAVSGATEIVVTVFVEHD